MILRHRERSRSNGKKQTNKQKMQEPNRKTNTTLLFSMRGVNSRSRVSSNKRKSRLRLPDPDRVFSWQTLTMTDPLWQAAYPYKTTRNSTLCRIKSDTERLNHYLISLLKIMERCVISTLQALHYQVVLRKGISSLASWIHYQWNARLEASVSVVIVVTAEYQNLNFLSRRRLLLILHRQRFSLRGLADCWIRKTRLF
jgi:hypothetical protein